MHFREMFFPGMSWWLRFFGAPLLIAAAMLFGLLCVVFSGVGLLLSDWFPSRCALCQRKSVRGGITSFHQKAGAVSRALYYCDACQQAYRVYDDGSVSIEILPDDQARA